MTIEARLAGLEEGEITANDVEELFDRVGHDEATSIKAVRHLSTIAEEYPELIEKDRHRIVPAIESTESYAVKGNLYRVARAIVERDASFLQDLFYLMEEDATGPETSTRLNIYESLKEGAENGVEIPEEVIDALISGIVAAPGVTPATSALNAYTSILESHPELIEQGLLVLVDFVESNNEQISTQAVRSLVSLTLSGHVPEDANREDIALTIEENYQKAGVPSEEAKSGVEKLR